MNQHQSIFVAIASYRDSECHETVQDLFENAKFPDRIRVGIVNQIIPGTDASLVLKSVSKQVDIAHFDARESLGACWAKSTAQKLWRGEDYILNIDAHMRFYPEWDRLVLETLQSCPDPARSIVSTYPPAYSPENTKEPGNSLMVPYWFETGGSLRFAALPKELESASRSIFLSGNFFFSPSFFLAECPYDPSVYQSGEEISMSVRAWTNGWDIVCPSENIVSHSYMRVAHPRHHEACPNWVRLHKFSELKVSLMLESDAEYQSRQVIRKKYGLGTERSLSDFQHIGGLDFKKRTIEDWATKGHLRWN